MPVSVRSGIVTQERPAGEEAVENVRGGCEDAGPPVDDFDGKAECPERVGIGVVRSFEFNMVELGDHAAGEAPAIGEREQ